MNHYVAVNNTTFQIANVQWLFEEAIEKITKEDWVKCIKHGRESMEFG